MFSEAIYMYREKGQKTERTKVWERVKGQNEKNKKQQNSYLIVKLQHRSIMLNCRCNNDAKLVLSGTKTSGIG